MFEDRNRGKGGFVKTFLTALVTSLGVGVLLFLFASQYIVRDVEQQPQVGETKNQPIPQPLSIQQQQTPNNTTQGGTIQGVAKSAMSGVVGISVLKVASSSIFDRNSESWGVGSGVIVSSNGYILTNHHVAGGKIRG